MERVLYLERIRANMDLTANKSTLDYLQRQHLLHVPFENLDIYSGLPVQLDMERFYQKIVLEKRGGYCYECNGLFHVLLQSLGFRSRMVSCKVINGKKAGPEFGHMAMIVSIGSGEWLVDVGFGEFSVMPLLLKMDNIQYDGFNEYLVHEYINEQGDPYFLVSKGNGKKKDFMPQYLIGSLPRVLFDFEEMNHFHQTSPDSHFTQNLICSKATDDGRISLVNNRLIITQNGIKRQERVTGDAAWNKLRY